LSAEVAGDKSERTMRSLSVTGLANATGLCRFYLQLIIDLWSRILVRRASVLPVLVAHIGINARCCRLSDRSVPDGSHRLGCCSLVNSGFSSPRSLILRLLDAGLARRRQIGVFSVGAAWSWRPLCGWLDPIGSSFFPCRTPCPTARLTMRCSEPWRTVTVA